MSVFNSVFKPSIEPVMKQMYGETLGVELVSNGTFDVDTTDWYSPRGSSTLSAISGQGRTTATGGTFGIAQQIDGLEIGVAYQVKGDVIRGTATGSISVRFDTVIGLNANEIASFGNPVDGSFDVEFVATATTHYFGCIQGGPVIGDYYAIDNMSVRRIF